MAKLTPQQRLILTDILTRDSNSGYHNLVYYLKQILSNQKLELRDPTKKSGDPEEFISLTATEAWDEIIDWSNKNNINLPMGDRGARNTRAKRLLNYLELNVQGKNREAAAASLAIKESVNQKPLDSYHGQSPQEVSYLTLNQIRNAQYEIIQAKLLGRLENELQKTTFFKKLLANSPKLPNGRPDPRTIQLLSGLMAANTLNLINTPNNKVFADELAQTIQLRAGDAHLNNASRLIYSQSAQEPLGEIDEIINVYNRVVSGDSDSEKSQNLKYLHSLSSFGQKSNLQDINHLINFVAPAASPQDKQKLISALKSSIIETLNSEYVSPDIILNRALDIAGIPDNQRAKIIALAPLIDEIRTTELSLLFVGGLHENDPRLLHTLNIANDTGVSPHIPWLDAADLVAQENQLKIKYKTDNLSDFYQKEVSRLKTSADNGKLVDFTTIDEVGKHLSNQQQHSSYQKSVSGNSLYYLRDKIGKIRGNFASVSAPVDRFAQKINKKVSSVSDFIHAPFAYIADKWLQVQEVAPILNPGKFLYDKVHSGQLWVAARLLEISDKLKSNKSWYSGIFSQVSDFAGGFIHHDADWSSSSFHFIQTKWGNLLDWSAKKAGFEGFQAVKIKVGTSLWNGFAKLAPGLAEKISSSGLSKLVGSLMLGELSAGSTLLIQAGAMVVWEGIKGVWNFLFNKEKREEMINNLPLAVWVGTAIGGLMALPSMIVGGVIAIGSALLSGLSAIATSLVGLFIPAMIISGVAVFLVYIFSTNLQTTARLDVNLSLDSGLGEFIGNILCDSGEGGGKNNSRIQTAACIAEILSKCSINPLTASNAQGSSWQCMLASTLAQSALAALQYSASNYSVLQCVGFIVAIDVANGGAGTGFGDAKTLLSSPPSGYKPVLGVGSCSPGDFFVDTTGTWGHTGVFIANGGATSQVADANGAGPGVVRGPGSGTWLSSNIAGCLKKI